MTILAGVLSRHPDQPPDDALCEALRAAVSRDPRDHPVVVRDRHACLVKVDVGAFGRPAVRTDPGGSVSMLTGEALLADVEDETTPPRDRELDIIHDGLLAGDVSPLKRAQGSFCAAHYRPPGRLVLMADKLGLRPIYWYANDRHVIFASALRILEALPQVPKVMDVRAVVEMAVFGYPLADRTPYVDVRLLRPAEVVEIDGGRVTRSQYWRWDHVSTSKLGEDELAADAYARARRAVTRRLRGDRTVYAYLSGGLDSRMIVTLLQDLGLTIHSVNLSAEGTQDRIFAEQFARAAGTIHEQYAMKSDTGVRPDWLRSGAEVWGKEKNERDWPVDRPHMSWTGQGGSVALGHVHMYEVVVRHMRAGQRDQAIEEWLRREAAAVPVRFLKRSLAARFFAIPREGLRAELEGLEAEDPARSFHVFLLHNDQRRNRARYYENIDLHRSEYHMPLFDFDLIESFLRVPVDLCLGHRFYMRWFDEFPALVKSAPWQTYPGHVPCPLPVPASLSYQWSSNYLPEARANARRMALERARAVLGSEEEFPGAFFNAPLLRAANWLYRTGVRDYGYLFNILGTYATYWKATRGQHVMPGPAAS